MEPRYISLGMRLISFQLGVGGVSKCVLVCRHNIITAKFTVHLQRYLQGIRVWQKASLLLAVSQHKQEWGNWLTSKRDFSSSCPIS